MIPSRRSRVLVSINRPIGFIAHLATSTGSPLCKLNLTLSLWQIEEVYRDTTIICVICRAIKARQA